MQEKLEKILGNYYRDEGNIISILQGIQETFGYLPEDAIDWVSERLDISPAKVYGIATFYTQFHLKPRGRNIITVCCGTACYVKGAERISNSLRRELKLSQGEETTSDGEFTLQEVACLGTCSLAPVVLIKGYVHGKAKVSKLTKEIKSLRKG